MGKARKPGKRVCAAFLAAVEAQYAGYGIDGRWGPVLDMEYDGWPTIRWEEGPFQWTYAFPHGGTLDSGATLESVTDRLPEGWFAERVNHYSLRIYAA